MTAARRYLRDRWTAETPPNINNGDYVVATKYRDGDPVDQFCIGFYKGFYIHYGETRHLVVDSNGTNFRINGFRRVARISSKRGSWMVDHLKHIETMKDRFSVWHWVRASWRELSLAQGGEAEGGDAQRLRAKHEHAVRKDAP